MTLAKQESYSLVLPGSITEIVALLRENFAPGQTANLDRVTIPAGGGLAFQVPGPAGPESVPDLTGVVLTHHLARAYWRGQEVTGSPPDCVSMDGLTGQGHPGGDCARCPLNQWGSDERGDERRSKACKEMHRVYLLRSGEILPIMLSLSPGSLAGMDEYSRQLTRKGISIKGVVTSFRLVQDRAQGGQVYSKAVPIMVGTLSSEDRASVRALGTAIEPVVKGVGIAESEEREVRGDATGRSERHEGVRNMEEEKNFAQEREDPEKPGRPLPPPPVLGAVTLSGRIAAAPEADYASNGMFTAKFLVQDAAGEQTEGVAVGGLAERIADLTLGMAVKVSGEYRMISRKGAMTRTFWALSLGIPQEPMGGEAPAPAEDLPF